MPSRQRIEPRPPQPEVSSWPGWFGVSRVTWFVVMVGLSLTLVFAVWSHGRYRASSAEHLAEKGAALAFSVEHALDDAAAQITATGSLFRASTHVTPAEFRTFVGDIGLIEGVLGLGYVPVIADADMEVWLEVTRREMPDLNVFELSDDGVKVPVRARELRFPLVYFEPFELFASLSGLDIGFHDQWRDELIEGLGAEGLVATTFIGLGLPGPLDDTDQLLVGRPVVDPATGTVSELVIAVVDLGTLVESHTPPEVLDGIVWGIADVAGSQSGVAFEPEWSSRYPFGGHLWDVHVAWEDPRNGLLSGAVVYPVAIGLTITLMLGAISRLLVARLQTRGELAALASLNEGKDDFLAAISHRLRTPLTSVVGFSEILSEADAGLSEHDRRELVSTIAVQAIELGHLFDNVLTVSRDADRAPFTPDRVVLADEIAAVLETTEPGRLGKIASVEVNPEITAAGDPSLVRQILRNLIANATDHGDTVAVSVGVDGYVASVRVRDDGPGVPADRLDEMFELYHHNEDLGQPDTMGVGLFVSRRLARRMSGDILYRRSPGWTDFELILPAMPAAVFPVARVAEPAAASD